MPIKQHIFQPHVHIALISFPAVTFTALAYGMPMARFCHLAAASPYFLLGFLYNCRLANISLWSFKSG